MPTLVIAVITGAVFLVSVLATRTSNQSESSPSSEEILSPPTITDSPSANPEATTTPSLSPTNSPTPSSIPSITTPTLPTVDLPNNLQLVYPGARQVSQTPNSQVYETSADANTVGKWYKDKLENQNFAIKNYISTNTNSTINITISLVESNNREIIIVIRQTPGSPTTITVTQ